MSSDNNQQNKISRPVIALIVGLCIVFSGVLLEEISLNWAFWGTFASCFVSLLIADRIIWSVVTSVLFGIVYSILTANSWESANGYTPGHFPAFLILRVFMGMLVAVIWGALVGFAIRRVPSWLNFVRHKQIRN